jgi:glutathione S-transferase
MLQLHYFPGNASLTPHLLLEELGAPYELKLVDRTQQAHKSAEYLKLNPNGLIPVLADGDLVLYETAAICLHLLDTHPQAGLAPALGTPQRAHFYKWLAWLSNTLQPTLGIYFYPDRWADAPEAVKQVKAHAEARVGELLDQLDAHFARHGGAWMMDEDFSALDLYALMLCRWTRDFARPARRLRHLSPFLRRVLDRPAVKRTFEQEQLAQPWV